MVDINFIYSLSMNKLQNFQTSRREGDSLRKWVLLNNFVYKKFSSEQDDLSDWSDEDIKKDEESWLESCLDELDDEEDGYVYINKPSDDPRNYNAQDTIQDNDVIDNNAIEQQPLQLPHLNSPSGNVIIPHDLLHLPYFGQVINEPQQLKDTSFQKDDISHPPPFHSFCLPEIFRNFCPSQRRPFDDSELLQPDYNNYCQPLESKSPLKRSKDDLDILRPKNLNKDLDRRALMKVIKMLEYYGGKKYYDDDKTNHKSSEIDNNNNIWFISNY